MIRTAQAKFPITIEVAILLHLRTKTSKIAHKILGDKIRIRLAIIQKTLVEV